MLARIVMVTAIALIFLLVGAPEDALACHKGDPPIPHGAATCDGGGGGGGTTSPILFDGNLEPIGTVVGVLGQPAVIIVVDVQNGFGDTRLTVLEAYFSDDDTSNPFNTGGLIKNVVRFDVLGCAGRAFITLTSPWTSIGGNIFASALMGRDANAEWCVATSKESEPFVARSQLGSDQLCIPVGPFFNVQGAPADLVEVNIFDRFPLPYSLEFR